MKNKIVIGLFLFIFSYSAFAAKDQKSEEVRNFVSEIGGKIITIADEKGSEKVKKDKIIAVIDSAIDANWIARFVLGKNYREASDEQIERFVNLYRDFMINTYGPKFKNYNGRKFDVKEVVMQSRFYVAKAEFLPRDSNIPILVDFRVRDYGGKLLILDFIAEGVSLIETQRSEFNSAISESGMNQFLDDLALRVKKLKS